MDISQKLAEFKHNLRLMIQRSKFSPLLQNRVKENSPAGEYLKSRGLSVDLEAYDFEGSFNYRGKEYQVPDSIVIPMRNRNGQLQGVWIRFLQEKRFYIWLVDDTVQKFWLDIRAEPGEDEPVYLAESIFDALSLRELFGFKNVGAVLGVAASAEMQEALKDFEVVMCFDRDSAGYKGMLAHLNNPRTQHWKVLEILSNSVDLSGIKDYNDIIKLRSELDGFDYNIKSSIQAKIYIKSKL
nr:MAG TPA: DNA primase (bacterial type) [Caudoviricetes sp.]